ncbi:MAG: hypothetical protein F6J87_04430 [Spirulina sp. SIO3F2]|nr:hypothetical protein [Spirulina sp. SIO3F2]
MGGTGFSLKIIPLEKDSRIPFDEDLFDKQVAQLYGFLETYLLAQMSRKQEVYWAEGIDEIMWMYHRYSVHEIYFGFKDYVPGWDDLGLHWYWLMLTIPECQNQISKLLKPCGLRPLFSPLTLEHIDGIRPELIDQPVWLSKYKPFTARNDLFGIKEDHLTHVGNCDYFQQLPEGEHFISKEGFRVLPKWKDDEFSNYLEQNPDQEFWTFAYKPFSDYSIVFAVLDEDIFLLRRDDELRGIREDEYSISTESLRELLRLKETRLCQCQLCHSIRSKSLKPLKEIEVNWKDYV